MKKLSFFLMAMLISVMSFAETESITLSSGTHDGSKITWTAANGNITISQLKAASSTAVNASYIAAPRMYKGHILKFECAEGYGITNIDITYNGSYYGTSLFAGTTMTSTTVTANTTDLTSTFATSNGGTHKIVAKKAEGEKLIALQIPNNAASGYKQLRPTAIKVTYAKAASSTPAIACGDVNFGTVNAANTNTKELEVVGENLTEVITATLEEGSAFSVSGSLDETGGTLTVTVTATEEGQYTDQLTLTSGTTTKTVAISAKVVACQGKGTKEEPYTIGDLTKLANPGTKAWVMGYIIGEIKDNELSTSGFENNSNIALADAIGETKKYAPIQLPSGAIRDALNLVSNPANLNKQVALYGTLEAYFSMPGVKSVSEYEWVVAPVVNHTITISANPAEAGTVTGAGEYEEGATATLTATANEGYEFVNWTENEVEVSTDAEYTFEVLADRNLVANFVEAAPEINYEEFIMSNLVVTTPAEGLEMLEASDPVNGISVMLGVYEDGTLHEDCLITFQGMELSIVSSEKVTKEYNEDVETDVYTVRVVVAFGGANMGLQLLMYATAAAEPIIINVEGATVTLTEYQISAEETAYELNMISNWVYEEDGLTYEVECLLPTFDPTKESGDYEASFFVRGEGNAFGMTEDAIVSVAKNGNQITLTGEITAYNNNVYNVTISGTLPVVEPTTITWELNGGELPTPAVPTNEELWIAFMPYYQEYYDVVRAEQPIASVAVFLSAGMGDDATIFTSEDSDYKWLGDYIIKVTTEQSAALTNLANWKFNAQAFFNAYQYTAWPKSADFTEAGKPENWGPAYQAANALVLPTEPVAEDYVLPTPTKSGSTFKGWYNNAEGTGEAYTVIPAGWAGTLYAIWEQGTTTALENIAVEGKAVKAIINGQLIIIKNGVQYNAQGQVIK